MKQILATLTVLFLLAACLPAAALAQETKEKEKQEKPQEKPEKEEPKGPLTGVWKCLQHAPERPDSDFQLDLEQRGEKITGTGSSLAGSAPLKGTFDNGKFQLIIEIEAGAYKLEGKLDGDKISGEWSFTGTGAKGTWEGKKS